MAKGRKNKKTENVNNIEDSKKYDRINVKISIPGSQSPCLLKMETTNSVNDIRQFILERSDCFFRTCFALYTDKNVRLDEASELGTIKFTDTLLLKMVDKPYQLKDLLTHYYRFTSIANFNPYKNMLESMSTLTLTICPILTGMSFENVCEKEFNETDLFNPVKNSLSHIYHGVDFKAKKLVKFIRLSLHNPPLNYKRLEGDILYIECTTLEDSFYGITAQASGFYLNKSTSTHFDASIAVNAQRFPTLDAFVSSFSPLYRKNFSLFLKSQSERGSLEMVPSSYPLHYWLGYRFESEEDEFRFLEMTSSYTTAEETVGFSRDWNEEMQSVKEMPSNDEEEIMSRNRYLMKIQTDFLNAALKAAVSVVDGRIPPLNNCEDEKMRMYLWNNLFTFISCDNKDLYKEFGGEIAGHAAVGVDISNLNFINSLNIDNLHLLGTSVVDYFGRRLIVQTVLPGIFHRNPDKSVEYGSVDHGKNIFFNEDLHKLSQQLGKLFRIQPLSYVDSQNKEHEFFLSLETKGLIGTDNRKYLLDFYRLFPPDHSFLPHDIQLLQSDINSEPITFETSLEFAQKLGFSFPHDYPHRLVTFRNELIKYLISSRSSNNDGFDILFAAFKNFGEPIFSADCFDVREERCKSNQTDLIKLRHCARRISSILVTTHIPQFVVSLDAKLSEIVDGDSLTDLLHEYGINIRYLGYIVHLLKNNDRLAFIKWICHIEMVCRAAKRILRSILSRSERGDTSLIVSHFLNCFVSSYPSIPPEQLSTEKSRNKPKKSQVKPYKINWLKLDSKTLWSCLMSNCHSTFGSALNFESIDDLCASTPISRTSLVRSLCKKVGIQILCRDYDYQSIKTPSFKATDVLGMYPVFKITPSVLPQCVEEKYQFVKMVITSAQIMVIPQLQDDLSLLLSFFKNMSGSISIEHAILNMLVAKLYSALGQPKQALPFQLKSTILCERVFGLDHYQTILAYYNLGTICKNCEYTISGINCFMRSRYLTSLVFGDVHPLIHEIDKNLAAVFYEVREYYIAKTYIENVMNYASRYDPLNLKGMAEAHQLNAATYFGLSDYRSAIAEEKRAYNLYKKLYKEDSNPSVFSSHSLLNIYLRKAISHEKAHPKTSVLKGSETTAPVIDVTPLD